MLFEAPISLYKFQLNDLLTKADSLYLSIVNSQFYTLQSYPILFFASNNYLRKWYPCAV